MFTRMSPKWAAVVAAAAVAGFAMVVGSGPGAAGPQGPQQEPVEGNPTCADLGYSFGFKIEASGEYPDEGTYSPGDPGTETFGDVDPAFEVTITYDNEPPTPFSFTASSPVGAVIVKAGPGAFVYTYDPPVTSASGLESPRDDSISHIDFCWDAPPTTTTTAPGATTTVPGETTTTAPGSTTEPGSTTSTVPGDTTTVPGATTSVPSPPGDGPGQVPTAPGSPGPSAPSGPSVTPTPPSGPAEPVPAQPQFTG